MAHKNYKLKHRALANKILVNILLDPSKHNQETWGEKLLPIEGHRPKEECFTTACVAGYAGLLTGNAEYVPTPYSALDEDEKPTEFNLLLTNVALDKFGGENRESFFKAGRKLLGLSKTDASVLFYETKDEQALQALAYIAADKKIDWKKIGIDKDVVETSYYNREGAGAY